jgi:APA family basic amino acid/polyamine antiporter
MDKISVPTATAVGLGAIIGAGIFVLSGTAIALAGPFALVAFALVGVLAIIIAMELGELGSLLPHMKGASYSYTYKAFGSELGFLTGALRYMALATSISVISLGFGSYLSSFIGVSGSFPIIFAIALIVVLSVVNMLGVKKAAQTDLILVLIKIGVLLVFVGFAAFVVMGGTGVPASKISFEANSGTIASIFAASVVVFFAYSGFQSISSITERIKDGARGYVRAILSAVTISIVLYVLVMLALLLLLPPTSYQIAADPLSYALKMSGAPQWLFALVDIGALVATTSAAVAMMLSASRSLLQMSEDKLLPSFLKSYNKRTDTAVNGIIVSAVVGIGMLFVGNIYIIAAIANFGLLFDYMIIGFDVIHFRRAGIKAPFRMPLYPYLTIVGIALLLIFFTGMPKEALVVGVVLLILLLGAYYSLREVRKKKIVRVRLFN